MSEHVPLRDFVERIIAENNLRRDDLRTEDNRALKLQAAEVERRLEAYPTLRDFNDLKNRVDIIVTLFQVLTGLSVVVGVVFAILTYAK